LRRFSRAAEGGKADDEATGGTKMRNDPGKNLKRLSYEISEGRTPSSQDLKAIIDRAATFFEENVILLPMSQEEYIIWIKFKQQYAEEMQNEKPA
jgi:hypothetical protein